MKINKINHYKVLNLQGTLEPNSVYYVLDSIKDKVKTYITDLSGIPIPLIDLTTESILKSVTGTAENPEINIENFVSTETSNLLKVSLQDGKLKIDNVLQLKDVNIIEKVSAENIPSYTPVVIINNQAYKFDASNINHQFAFSGFSKNGTSAGQMCSIQYQGELTLVGWGLIPSTQYLADVSGMITIDNTNSNNFTKVLGYAISEDTLQIIKDYTTINKNYGTVSRRSKILNYF
jgi:hypothetical protein